MSRQSDEYRRRMGMNMTTGANNMADMQFSIRRPMQEERDRMKLLEAYWRGGGAVLGMSDSEGGEP